MQIGKNKVALIEYTLTDDDGDVIDSSVGGDPLAYVHGTGSLIPGLEAALEGRVAGDALDVTIAPAEAYGVHDPELVHVASREQFAGTDEILVGMRFRAGGEGGGQVMAVVAVDEEQVTLDGNHPLAGVTLHFAVKVVGVRDATAQEISAGRAREADGQGQ